MFKYLQSRIRGTASTGPGEPPAGLLAFYWHFVRQTKGWYALMFVTSLAVALIDTVIPVFIGKLVSLMGAADRRDRKSTRLNSSHLVISYAVFCLKKKKTLYVYENRYVESGVAWLGGQSMINNQ